MRSVILGLFVLVGCSLMGCGSRGGKPAGSDGDKPAVGGSGDVGPAKGLGGSTYTETMENGLLVIRTRYASATKFTPQFAARFIEEYDTLKQADPKQEPAEFWEKYGSGKLVLEVEGTVEQIRESKAMDHLNRPYMDVTMHIVPTGSGWSEGKAALLNKVDARNSIASQTARGIKPGQKVIVRGQFSSFETEYKPVNGEFVPIRRNPVLQMCQLVFPKDG